MSGQKNDVTYAATVAFAVAKMRELGWMPPSNTSTDPPQDDLIERLRAVKWEVTDDCGRMPDDPTHKCVFVDMRPDDFRELLREAADALEAAREDASEAKQNGYELGLLAASQGAAREDACVELVADIRLACGDNGKRMQPELVEYIRELAKDAARYRWLREECKSPIGGLTIASVTEWGLEGWSGDDPDNRIDAAIDQARRQEVGA